MINQGDGTFSQLAQTNWGSPCSFCENNDDIVFGDFNGDAKLDIATRSRGNPEQSYCSNVCHVSGDVKVYLNLGSGVFGTEASSLSITTQRGTNPTVRAGDIDLDGAPGWESP